MPCAMVHAVPDDAEPWLHRIVQNTQLKHDWHAGALVRCKSS